MKKLRIALVCGLIAAGAGAQSGPVVNPANNPLLGSWVNTEGKYGCDKTRTFLAHTQTWIVVGKTVTAPATYAVEGTKVYVQEHLGSGGTTAFIVLSKNEIMDKLGTGACHWKRQ